MSGIRLMPTQLLNSQLSHYKKRICKCIFKFQMDVVHYPASFLLVKPELSRAGVIQPTLLNLNRINGC